MQEARSFAFLGGQSAPVASNGRGVRALYQCPQCQRIWLQDGKITVLELSPQHVEMLAQEVGARDLQRLPTLSCSLCLYRQGQGRISVDEYAQGQGFGLCWEMVRPTVLHATSVLQSEACALQAETKADVLTHPAPFRAVLRAATDAALPGEIQRLPQAICCLQAADQPPGLGQPGTEAWQWRGWFFTLPCPPLAGEALVTLLLALPPTEALSSERAFRLWQVLLAVALHTV